MKKPIAKWTVRETSPEGPQDAWWEDFAIYPGDVTDEEIESEWFDYYGGPGMPFSRRPLVWRTPRWVLVSQMGGVDC